MQRRDPAIEALLQATRPDAIGDRYAERDRSMGQAAGRAAYPMRLGKIVDGLAHGQGNTYVLDANGTPISYFFLEIDRRNLAEFIGSATKSAAGVVTAKNVLPPGGSRNTKFVPLPVDGTCLVQFVERTLGIFTLIRVVEAVIGDMEGVEVCQTTNMVIHRGPFREAFWIDVLCATWLSLDKFGHVRYIRTFAPPGDFGPGGVE